MTKTILNKIGEIAKNSWKILPIGSAYNYHKNHHYETDSIKDAIKWNLHELYGRIPILIVAAYLYNGIENKEWNIKDCIKDVKQNSQEFKATIQSKLYPLNH